MGVVYRADDLRLGRQVALKFLPEELAKDQVAVERLRSEARAASALNHGNICTIYDIDEDDGQPFIAMELMTGQTLRDRLAAGPLKIHQLVDIGIQVSDALDAAHRQNIVHRDIKPANIFLTDRHHPKILDFGLAKSTVPMASSSTTGAANDQLTAVGVTLGTISYMSPEQATGEELDGRTDLFSLGVVLYECATGHQPFSGKTSAVILASILSKAPVAPVVLNPELPLRLQEVINNCLEKDRELRYQSAADLRADLKRVRRDIESGHSRAVETIDGRAPSSAVNAVQSSRRSVAAVIQESGPAVPAAPSQGRNRGILMGATIAAVVVLAGVAFMLRLRDQPAAPATSATGALSDATAQSRLDLATASFDARNYRAALAYSGEVLAVAPNHAGAMRIRDDARAMIARFDEAIAAARQRVATGDISGAAQALEAARSLDPTAPVLSELAARVADQVRQKDSGGQNAPRQSSRSTAESASSAPAARGSTTQARPEAPREQTPPPSPVTVEPPPQVASRGAAPPPAQAAPPPVAAPITPAPPVAQPAAEPAAASARPAPPPVSAPAASEPSQPAARAAEDDDAAIRRVVATYGRAIENKDLTLFRSIKPNLSREEERRLQEGFRAVSSQQVNLTVLAIDRRGPEATVTVRRRDTIQIGGRQQNAESQQTMRLARSTGAWVILEIR
jgi:hypothetical protein